jgi:hypothetical protein
MRNFLFRNALAMAVGAGLLLAGPAGAQSPGFGKSGQPAAIQQNQGKAGIIISDGTWAADRPEAIEPGDIFLPGQRGSAVARPLPKAPQGSGAAGAPMIEPGEIFRPGQ